MLSAIVFVAALAGVGSLLLMRSDRPQPTPMPSVQSAPSAATVLDDSTAEVQPPETGNDEVRSAADTVHSYASAWLEPVDIETIEPELIARYDKDELRVDRVRFVNVDADRLRAQLTDDSMNRVVELPMFPDVVITALLASSQEYTEGQRSGWVNWSGKLSDNPNSVVSIIVSPGRTVRASIAGTKSPVYRMRSVDGGAVHVVTERILTEPVRLD